MSYTRVNWQNKPSTATPINATNLNTMDAGIKANDTAIGTLTTALNDKVDKVAGYGLSKNDFSDAYKDKVDGIEAGAEVNVQADWNEADNTADEYIKNKPDLSVYAEKDTLWSDATASGNPVTIKTQSAQAAKSTELTMLPVQDLHGYGKPWVGGTGKNLCQPFTSGTSNNVTLTQNADGSITLSGTASAQASMFTVPVNIPTGTTVAITFNNSVVNSEVGIRLTDVANARYGTPIMADAQNKYGVVSAAWDAKEINVFVKTNHGDVPSITLKVQVELGSTPTAWTPWENICPISGRTGAEIVVKDEDDVTQDTVTISFGSTVYGGSLDVESGELSVEWAYIASYNGETITEPWISDRDEYIPNTTPSTGAEVAYKLASPTTTTLTAAQVNLIKGLNNVSTDADGLTITYFADGESLTDADNRITAVLGDLATVEGARASQNYAVGDYLVFDDKFCKASAAIASGEALVIGTNLMQTTVGAELKAILAQL